MHVPYEHHAISTLVHCSYNITTILLPATLTTQYRSHCHAISIVAHYCYTRAFSAITIRLPSLCQTATIVLPYDYHIRAALYTIVAMQLPHAHTTSTHACYTSSIRLHDHAHTSAARLASYCHTSTIRLPSTITLVSHYYCHPITNAFPYSCHTVTLTFPHCYPTITIALQPSYHATSIKHVRSSGGHPITVLLHHYYHAITSALPSCCLPIAILLPHYFRRRLPAYYYSTTNTLQCHCHTLTIASPYAYHDHAIDSMTILLP